VPDDSLTAGSGPAMRGRPRRDGPLPDGDILVTLGETSSIELRWRVKP
jgi:hypothetical protein